MHEIFGDQADNGVPARMAATDSAEGPGVSETLLLGGLVRS